MMGARRGVLMSFPRICPILFLLLIGGFPFRCSNAVNVTTTEPRYRPVPHHSSTTRTGVGVGVGAATDVGGEEVKKERTCPTYCSCFKLNMMTSCRGREIKTMAQLGVDPDTEHLILDDTDIERLNESDFEHFSMLKALEISSSHKLSTIETGTFSNLQHLKLIELRNLPLRMPLNSIFKNLPEVKQLVMTGCNLDNIPDLSTFAQNEEQRIAKIDLSNNNIKNLRPEAFEGLRVHKLILARNKISYVQDYAFKGSTIISLSLALNPITELAENAFAEFEGPQDLSLEQTLIQHLPTTGLKYLIELNLMETYSLKHFPSIFRFERIRVANLTYFSHCCAFNYQTQETYGNLNKQNITTKLVRPTSCPSTTTPPVTNKASGTFGSVVTLVPGADTMSRGGEIEDYGLSIFPAFSSMKESQSHYLPFDVNNLSVEDITQGTKPAINGGAFHTVVLDPNKSYNHSGSRCDGELVPIDYSDVVCTPQPNAFHPCTDVMGYVFLRVMVWIVSSTALIGNFIVLFVLASQRHKMTVPKFLMCNLSLADLCMGLYLLMVASVDIHTAGEYFNYSFQWQYGAGCSVAGFISMLSSELSVFSLTVITIERWYTIIYAIDLNKRIRLRLAARIMIAGWVFSILVAVLPLFKIGNYGITSMCLPFYIANRNDTVTIAYVIFILFVNTLAFAVICACYIKMYLSVRNPHTVMQRKDSKVAKRMAVLVFTDFACWAPMALFGLSGAFGRHLLTTNQSKIFIVLFYPINSCANPFLYAIFTKAFRRDLCLLLAKHGICERQAMKYHPTATTGQRSVSQINSTAHDRNRQNHRDSSGSVLTGVTNDNHSSLAPYDRDYISNGSPHHGPRANSIPMVALHEDGNEHEHDSNCQEVSSASASAPFAKRVSVTFEVNVDGLETVPEEVHQNDNYDGGYETSVSFYSPDGKVPNSEPIDPEYYKEKHCLLLPHQVSSGYHVTNDADTRCTVKGGDMNRNNCRLNLATHRDKYGHTEEDDTFRKNSRADSGIQSVNTTPTDKDVHRQPEGHHLPCAMDHETVL